MGLARGNSWRQAPDFLCRRALGLQIGHLRAPAESSSISLAEGSAPLMLWFDDQMKLKDDPYICARARDGNGRYYYSRMSVENWLRLRWLILDGTVSG